MPTKRIIPCLDIKDGRTVKGVNFEELRDAGDAVELAKLYSNSGADELIFLDITATSEKRKTLIPLVEKIAEEINIPFTVGGGISTLQDATTLLRAGADKISINSAAVKNPSLIREIAGKFGNQCVVLATDAKQINKMWKVFINGGKTETKFELLDWCKKAVEFGAGEILFTSMDNDGTKNGFAIDALKHLSANLSVPVIASGGAGKIKDFIDVFRLAYVDAALAASVFHFKEIDLKDLKKKLEYNKISVRPCMN